MNLSSRIDRFLLAVLALWTLFTLLSDGLLVWDLNRMMDATRYPYVLGVITRNETRSHDYDLYEAEIEYIYQVEDIDYSNNRWIYDAMMFGKATSGGERRVKTLASQYPEGRALPVYYNPSDPADSVLAVGFRNYPRFELVGLGLFNFAMVLGWMLLLLVRANNRTEGQPEEILNGAELDKRI